METRNTSGIFIQILMTRFFDLVTANNLKRWFQKGNLRSQVVQATTQTSASRAKTARRAENQALLKSGESRTCSVWKNLPRINFVDLVTYMSIREVLVKVFVQNLELAKFLPIFCSLKIGSKQNWL